MAECEMYGVFIKQIHDELERQINNQLRSEDLTMAQVGTLGILNRTSESRMPLKELERKLHVAQSTALGIVSRLERKGLVECFGDPADRRVKMVQITDNGIHCCHMAVRHVKMAEEHLLAGLADEERAVFYTLLLKLCKSFDR